MSAYIDAMRRYATFSGRSTRTEFWYYHLVFLALAFGGLIIDVVIAGSREPQPLVSALIVIGHYLPSLAIIVRRLLAALRSSGAITDAEFETMKASILQNLQPSQKPA